MAIIENTTEIPEVSDDFHLLQIEGIELVEGTKYGEPDVPETRIKMTLRVLTPGEEQVSFAAWMSQNLGEKATLGSIYRAIAGQAPPRGGIDTDDLIGRRFRHMITHNDNGWPKLVAGTAASAKSKGATVAAPPENEEYVTLSGKTTSEPPF